MLAESIEQRMHCKFESAAETYEPRAEYQHESVGFEPEEAQGAGGWRQALQSRAESVPQSRSGPLAQVPCKPDMMWRATSIQCAV